MQNVGDRGPLSRDARKHAKRLLKSQLGVTRHNSPGKKRYRKLVNELAANLVQLNSKLQNGEE